ncbi:hypothetical protein [Acinetobacter sp. 826659]|uniref:hypothetical protein n=1 Tax=Acinetobacter sp. 826659 TaxID=1310764 RepID=UPI000451387C|nr:hypothetical protein [Acinetobacter sp. 826659]EXS33548.1 hypothetical protein J663_2886 [Acinetobacter sp. 826659]
MVDNIIHFKKRREKKGLILSGAGGVKNENGIVAKELHDEDLMYYGLYWDNIIITQIPMFQFSNPLIDQFRSNGVVDFFQNAPPESVHSSQMQKLALESLIACQSVKKQNKEFDWLIYNNVSDSFNGIDSEEILEAHAIRIKIAECLPYPSKYVPIDVLRRFREDNIEQLDNLHYEKYKLFEKISNFDSKDKRELAEQYEITAFDKAIKDYQDVFAARFPAYSLKPIIADIKNNKPTLWEIGATVGDMLLTGGSLAGIYNVGKLGLEIFGNKQKIHQAKLNSPQFHFISNAIEQGVILQNYKS